MLRTDVLWEERFSILMYDTTWVKKNKIYQVLFIGAFTCFYIFKTVLRVTISVAQGTCAKKMGHAQARAIITLVPGCHSITFRCVRFTSLFDRWTQRRKKQMLSNLILQAVFVLMYFWADTRCWRNIICSFDNTDAKLTFVYFFPQLSVQQRVSKHLINNKKTQIKTLKFSLFPSHSLTDISKAWLFMSFLFGII